jgi:integrase
VIQVDPIENWIRMVAYSHSKSKGTEYNYRSTIADYCKFHNITPKQVISEYEKLDEKTFKHKHTQMIQQWIAYLYTPERDNTTKTIKSKVGSISSFYHYNDLPLGHIPQAREMVTYHNRDIEAKEIAQIIALAQPREKAFYAIIAQSGLRPCTIGQLRIKHIEPLEKDQEPYKITVPQELTKGQFGSHVTFIGDEARKYLKGYLTTRSELTEESLLFCTHEKPNTPVNTKNISRSFQRTAKELRKNKQIEYKTIREGKPSEIRLYNLRKFFKRKSKDMGDEDTNYMMGHTITGANGNYRPQDPEYYRKRYEEKALPFLRLEEPTPSDTKELTEALKTTMEAQHKEQIKALKEHHEKELETYKTEKLQLKTQLSNQTSQLADQQKQINEILRILGRMMQGQKFAVVPTDGEGKPIQDKFVIVPTENKTALKELLESTMSIEKKNPTANSQ